MTTKFNKKVFIVLIAALSLSFTTRAEKFISRENMPYDRQWERCVADIFFPDSVEKPLPVVIWWHGGGLTGGNKFIPEELMTGEYVVVAPNYRLMPDYSIEDCIDDAAKAVVWVMDSISSYGGDSGKIFISGHSAGGYLASMIGLDRKWMGKYGKDPDTLKGIIPFSGQVITHFAQRKKNGISELTPTIDEFAPAFHIRKDAPPYIIITGDRELELYGRYEENAYIYRMMKLAGHPYVYIYEIGGFDHGDMYSPAFHILKTQVKKILQDEK